MLVGLPNFFPLLLFDTPMFSSSLHLGDAGAFYRDGWIRSCSCSVSTIFSSLITHAARFHSLHMRDDNDNDKTAYVATFMMNE